MQNTSIQANIVLSFRLFIFCSTNLQFYNFTNNYVKEFAFVKFS